MMSSLSVLLEMRLRAIWEHLTKAFTYTYFILFILTFDNLQINSIEQQPCDFST